MGFGGSGGGGGGSISAASDVALNNPLNNNVLSYNSTTSKWTNSTVPTVVPEDWGILPSIYWDGDSWPARVVPSGYSGPVVWDSATDPTATVPASSIAGDRWLRRVG